MKEIKLNGIDRAVYVMLCKMFGITVSKEMEINKPHWWPDERIILNEKDMLSEWLGKAI